MKSNPVIECLLDHKSIRAYTDEAPTDEVIETMVRAAQQAPFAAQSYSFLLSRDRSKNAFKAPLLFTVCVDMYKFERIMEVRGWKRRTNMSDPKFPILGTTIPPMLGRSSIMQRIWNDLTKTLETL